MDFSPLFIGDSCSTPPKLLFYSTALPISVPSSSGTRVQLVCGDKSHAAHVRFQSPLHRGLVFNSRKIGPLVFGRCVFQSPLHRGLVFNAILDFRRPRLCLISVPSSSGTRVQLPGSPMVRQAFCISVPSSSGTRVQPCAGGNRRASVCRFQSPLHRGLVFNRSWKISLRDLRSISVPSSSGTRVQRRGAFA